MCRGTGPLVLQIPPPTEVLVPGESCPWWTGVAAPLSCFSGFSAGCSLLGDCSSWLGQPPGQGTSALSTMSGSVPSSSRLLGSRKRPREGSWSGVEDLDPRGSCEVLCWGAAEQQAMTGGTQELGRWEKLKKWGWGHVSWIRRAWGCTEPLVHRNISFFKTKFTGTTMNMNCFAKGCCLLLLVQGLRHAFVIFPFCSPSANLWPLTVSVYFQNKSVGSLCFDRSSKPTPPTVSTLLL